VKLSTLLELIGSGSILLTVGAAAILLGVGIGLSEATQLPLWVSFCGLGLLAAAVGYALIDRGSDEAEEQVQQAMSPMVDFVRSPWAGMAAAIIGGIVLQRLVRRKRDTADRPVSATPVAVAAPSAPDEAKPNQSAKAQGFSLSRYLGNQLSSLGSVAAEAAVAMGMQTLGVPSLEELVRDLLGADKQQKPAGGPPPGPFERDSSEWQTIHRDDEEMQSRSARPSHNGFNYAEFGREA
jgi:hypothetical protein